MYEVETPGVLLMGMLLNLDKLAGNYIGWGWTCVRFS